MGLACMFRSFLALLAVAAEPEPLEPAAPGCASQNQPCSVDLLQRRLELDRKPPPHILFFLADDLGWAGFRRHREGLGEAEAQGRAEIQAPRLERLIREGILLERHYTTNDFSAKSRCSLWSGRLPEHCYPDKGNLAFLGLHHNDQMYWNRSDNVSGFAGMPRNMTGLAKQLKQAGYESHYVGKWDNGWATPEHTALGRGFDSFLGSMQPGTNTWKERQFNNLSYQDICFSKYQDFSLYNKTYRNGVTPEIRAELGCNFSFPKDADLTETGCLKEDPTQCLEESCLEDAMFLRYALKTIDAHDTAKPLFLTVASHMVHTPLAVPKSTLRELDKLVLEAGVERKLAWTKNRRLIAASILYMDKMMGALVDALKKRDMYENTLIVFASDNGGGTNLEEASSNYPLKGGKGSDWEGAVRTNAFVSGGFVPPDKRDGTFHGVIHIADWYATLCSIAGVDYYDFAAAEVNKDRSAKGLPLLHPVDGRPQWSNILSGTNARSDTLFLSRFSLLRWPYKLVTGRQPYFFWPGPVWPNCSSDRPEEDFYDIFTYRLPEHIMPALRANYQLAHDCGSGCLYNVEMDPGERSDLAARPAFSQLLESLVHELEFLNQKASSFRGKTGVPRVEACLTALDNAAGALGPFVDIEGFYTDKPFLHGPAADAADRDRQEILSLHKALQESPEEIVEMAANIVNSSWTPPIECLSW